MLAGCASGFARSTLAPPAIDAAHPFSTPKIQHVVIVIQENRSFDNLFQGFPGADSQSYGRDSNGNTITLKPIGFTTPWDIDHSSTSFFAACDGAGQYPGTKCRMDGFDREKLGCGGPPLPACPAPEPEYAYVPAAQTAPYVAIGKQYVLADRMFASNFDASSFVSHQYIIAGQAGQSAVDFPNTVWGCDGGPYDTIATVGPLRQIGAPYPQACFDDPTLGDEADAAGISWTYYTVGLKTTGSLWSAYQAIRHIRYGPDWHKNVKAPPAAFLADVKNGNLPQISWVTPTCANSDHAGCSSDTGPSWVASLVNAIGESKYWDSTAMFVFWDDYGGWYDHVPPKKLDYDGLGMRVPMLIVSPYAKQGYVSHVQYEHGSILKFVEDQFGLGRLAASDRRATSPATDCFDFSQPPRAFVPIPAKYALGYFLHQPLDRRIPDAR